MKAAILALVVGLGLVAHTAAAHASCHSRSHIVGHSRCHRFGAGWEPPLVAWGFEGVFLHFDPGPETFDPSDKAGNRYHFQTVGPTKTEAIGGRYRYQLGWRGYYLADEFTFAGLVKAPGIVGGPVGTAGPQMTDAIQEPPPGSSGFLFGWDLAFGKLVSRDDLFLSAEVAGGVRCVSYDSKYPIMAASISGTIEPRVRVGYWIAPWLSIAGFAGANVLSTGDYELGLSLGVHVMPYDATR